MVIIVMGVSGSGKTAVGQAAAAELGWEFHDADDEHPAANIEKMLSGKPLNALDRAPWVARLKMLIREWLEQNRNVFLACSALTQTIREELKGGDPDVHFVYLKGDAERIQERLRKREGHFMPASLVASQFETLEQPAPAEALIVDALGPIEEIVGELRRRLKRQ